MTESIQEIIYEIINNFYRHTGIYPIYTVMSKEHYKVLFYEHLKDLVYIDLWYPGTNLDTIFNTTIIVVPGYKGDPVALPEKPIDMITMIKSIEEG